LTDFIVNIVNVTNSVAKVMACYLTEKFAVCHSKSVLLI
jgi:hypothetical protein